MRMAIPSYVDNVVNNKLFNSVGRRQLRIEMEKWSDLCFSENNNKMLITEYYMRKRIKFITNENASFILTELLYDLLSHKCVVLLNTSHDGKYISIPYKDYRIEAIKGNNKADHVFNLIDNNTNEIIKGITVNSLYSFVDLSAKMAHKNNGGYHYYDYDEDHPLRIINQLIYSATTNKIQYR